jgi:hypothetical protein
LLYIGEKIERKKEKKREERTEILKEILKERREKRGGKVSLSAGSMVMGHKGENTYLFLFVVE